MEDKITTTRQENSPQEGWQPKVDGVIPTENKFTQANKTTKYKSLPYNPKLKNLAKQLRKAGNLSEVIFWNAVKKGQLLNLDFERQKIIGNYIVDFYCPELDLVVEIDGESHDYKGSHDLEREKYLNSLGLDIIHFEDFRIKKDFDRVKDELYWYCSAKKSPRQSATATPQEGNIPLYIPSRD